MNTARRIAQSQFAQYGMNSVPADTLDRYASDILKDQKARNQIYNQTVDSKLFNGVRALVNLENKEVSVEEFNDLFRN